MNEPSDVVGKIMPAPPTINQVFVDLLRRIEHLEQANKPAWFEMWRRYDGLLARIEDLERALNKMQREAFEVRVGQGAESEGSR